MKKTLLAAAIAMTASNAFAGTVIEPTLDVTIITQDASSLGAVEWLAPAVFVFMLVLLAGGSKFYKPV